jgi:hypothetical protein
MMITIALPDQQMHDRLAQHLTQVNLIVWSVGDGAPPQHIDLAVWWTSFRPASPCATPSVCMRRQQRNSLSA